LNMAAALAHYPITEPAQERDDSVTTNLRQLRRHWGPQLR